MHLSSNQAAFLHYVGRSRNNEVGLLPGISLGTGGGVFFLYSNVLEAFFAWGLILKDCGREMEEV
jgi:hypothetical protein